MLKPHLLSVAAAADKIDNEHTRFVDCGYYGASRTCPSVRCGSSPRAPSQTPTDARARYKTPGMPRDELFCINGEPASLSMECLHPFLSTAIAVGAEHVEEQKHLDDDARRPFDRRVVVKAGTYVRSRSTSTRLPDDRSTAALYRWLKQARTLVPGRWDRRRRHTSTRPQTAQSDFTYRRTPGSK